MNSIRRVGFRALQTLPLALAALLAASAASATSGIMNISGSVTLTENHTGTIVLNGPNARLNCNGKSIIDSTQPAFCGEAGNESCGIYISGVDYPYVINCTVRNFDIGLYAAEAYLPTVRNSTFRSNVQGMKIVDSTGSSGTFLQNNLFQDNSEEGLAIRRTTSLRVLSNKFWYNDLDGTDVNNSSRLVFNLNDHSGNSYNGLEVDTSTLITVTNGKFVLNGNTGLTGEFRSGLSFDNVDQATVTGNTLNKNERNGIRVTDGSSNGTYTNNTGSGNVDFDAYQSNSSTGNTWSGNTWGDSSPSTL